MRRFTVILILVSLIVLVGPSLHAGQVPPVTSDLVAKEQTLSTGRYDERASLVVPERPLGFAAEIQYQASVDGRRNVPKPAFLRLTVAPPGGRAREEIALKPGEKKSGVLRLPPGHQLRVESYSGQYTTLLIKNGADIKCKLRWPEFRFTAQEQTRHYGFAMTAAGWQEVDRWVWDFGDGKGAEGAAVEHLYRAPGTYRLEV
ncbi:MAG: PKD domain-containing protein, partial [Bacteroidota bacterium]